MQYLVIASTSNLCMNHVKHAKDGNLHADRAFSLHLTQDTNQLLTGVNSFRVHILQSNLIEYLIDCTGLLR